MTVISPKLEQLAQRLASLTGEDVETALERAVEERISRLPKVSAADRRAALQEFFARMRELPVKDNRSPDEIVGYGPDGLPT